MTFRVTSLTEPCPPIFFRASCATTEDLTIWASVSRLRDEVVRPFCTDPSSPTGRTMTASEDVYCSGRTTMAARAATTPTTRPSATARHRRRRTAT